MLRCLAMSCPKALENRYKREATDDSLKLVNQRESIY